jgi:hypothetical protein
MTNKGNGNRAPSDMLSSSLQVALISAAAAIIGAALTFAGAYYTGLFQRLSKDGELHVELVKIAVGILAIKKGDAPAQPRNWAIDVMERNTNVTMTPEERKKLVEEGGLQGVAVLASSPFKCVPAANGRYLRLWFDPATGTYSRGELVDANQCQ